MFLLHDRNGVLDTQKSTTSSRSDEVEKIYHGEECRRLYAMVKFDQGVNNKFQIWMDIMEKNHAKAVIAKKSKNGYRYDKETMKSTEIIVQDHFRCEISIGDMLTPNSVSSPKEIFVQFAKKDNYILIPVKFDPNSSEHDYGVIECKYQCNKRQECIILNVSKEWCKTEFMHRTEVTIYPSN